MEQELKEVIEAPLEDLLRWQLIGRLKSPESKSYAQILIFYLQSNAHDLIKNIPILSLSPDLRRISEFRSQILLGKTSEQTVDAFKATIDDLSPYSGEMYFVLGQYFLRNKRNKESSEAFKNAHNRLESQRLFKKANKALLNMIVAESRLNPEQRLIWSYNIVAQNAQKLGDRVVEGLCHQNISKELYDVGAYDTALYHVNAALELLSNDKGTAHYFEVLLHRCCVFIRLDRLQEAHKDFEYAKISQHSQIKAALDCIRVLLESPASPNLESLEPAWLDKLNFNSEALSLGHLESKLIVLLKDRPRHRNDLIIELYGNAIDWDSARNRFKVLLSRLKKKRPHLIVENKELLYLAGEQSVISGSA